MNALDGKDISEVTESDLFAPFLALLLIGDGRDPQRKHPGFGSDGRMILQEHLSDKTGRRKNKIGQFKDLMHESIAMEDFVSSLLKILGGNEKPFHPFDYWKREDLLCLDKGPGSRIPRRRNKIEARYTLEAVKRTGTQTLVFFQEVDPMAEDEEIMKREDHRDALLFCNL